MVQPPRFELGTSWSTIRRSNQLSYGCPYKIYLPRKPISLKFSLMCFHCVEAFGTDMAQGVNMASIVLRKNRWRVQIRKQGHSYFSKTFLYKENAERRNLNPRPFVPKTSNIPILKFKKIFWLRRIIRGTFYIKNSNLIHWKLWYNYLRLGLQDLHHICN